MLRSYESCVSRARAQKPPCQAAGRRGIMSAGTRQEGTAGVASRTRILHEREALEPAAACGGCRQAERGESQRASTACDYASSPEKRMSDYELIMIFLTVLLLLATVCIGFMSRK